MEYLSTFVYGASFTIVCIVLTFVITVYPKLRRRKAKPLSALDIIRIIRRIKPFPICASGLWKLCAHTAEHRIWIATLKGHPLPQPIDVFGCFTKVKGSPQYILSSLRDVSKYPEWLPGVQKVKQVVGCPELEPMPKTKGPGPPPVYHDVINVTLTSTPHSFIGIVNRIAEKIQSMPLIDRIKTKHRYWGREENNCCWMLELCEEDHDWYFYLVQPVEGFFGDTSLITLMVFEPQGVREREHHLIAALRLGALSNFLTYRKVQVTPLTSLTLPITVITSGLTSTSTNTSTGTSTGSTPAQHRPINNGGYSGNSSFDDVDKLQDDEIKNEPSFINKVRKLIEEKKELYEERKRLQQESAIKSNETSSDPPSQKVEVASSILQHSSSRQRSGSSSGQREPSFDEYDEVTIDDYINGIANLACEDNEEPVQNGGPETGPLSASNGTHATTTTRIERKSILTFLRSHSQASEDEPLSSSRRASKDSDSDLPQRAGEAQDQKASPTSGGFGRRLLQRLRSLDESRAPPSPDDVMKTSVRVDEDLKEEGDSGADDDEADLQEYRAIAESVATELLKEKAQISRLDITRPYDEQSQHSAGWIYCGLEKDVVILRKIFQDGTPHQCYLGKGLICAPPKAVFEALKNPQTRFTYDEMLKKVEVLEDFENGLSIVYLYHEVSQLFRKEARDFCLLQCEQIDGVKYIITYRSVVYSGCPEKHDIIRAKFLPSGWIIEPVTKDEKLFSMVTYIVQMELGMNKTNTGYLVEELAAKQPLSIAHLRHLLVPQTGGSSSRTGAGALGGPAAMRRSASVGQLRQRHLAQPVGASTLALAAMSSTVARDPSAAEMSDSSTSSSNRSAPDSFTPAGD